MFWTFYRYDSYLYFYLLAMSRPTQNPVALLPDDLQNQVQRMISQKFPALEIVAFLARNGYPNVTPKQVYNYKQGINTPTKKVLNILIDEDDQLEHLTTEAYCSESGITTENKLDRLTETLLEVVDILSEHFKSTGSLRVVKNLIDCAGVVDRLLDKKLVREEKKDKERLESLHAMMQNALEMKNEALQLAIIDPSVSPERCMELFKNHLGK